MPHDRTEYSLGKRLSALAAASPNKGERTRLRLKAAAARLLGSTDYHAVQMLDISRAAGLSNGAVYRYFENKTTITIEVLRDLMLHIGRILGGTPAEAGPHEEFLRAYVQYTRLYRENSGLMRCLHRLGDTIPEARQLVEETYAEWCGRLTGIILNGGTHNKAERRRTMVTTRALAVMGDEFLYDLYVRRSPMLVELDKEPGAVASMLATIFHRSVYGRDPEDQKPGRTGKNPRRVRARARAGGGAHLEINPFLKLK